MTLLSDAPTVTIYTADNHEPLVELRDIPELWLAGRLAAKPGHRARLRTTLVDRLVSAQQRLPRGIRLLIVEAYRPYRPEEPDLPDPHRTGGAVDVTLCTDGGVELDLGSRVLDTPEASANACYTAARNIPVAALRNLIEISRFDARSAALLIDAVPLADAVANCLRVRGWTQRVVVEPLPDLRVRCDPRRLDVIIANLVGNALRHGARPVTVRAWTRHAAGHAWLALRVHDRGPGMPAEVLPHVFDRFYKADTARTRSEGSGLGLAIAWENARLHGGTIEAANAPEGGASFTLHLPLSPEPGQAG